MISFVETHVRIFRTDAASIDDLAARLKQALQDSTAFGEDAEIEVEITHHTPAPCTTCAAGSEDHASACA